MGQRLIQTRDDALAELLEGFCARTRRDQPHTLRQILSLFFEHGEAVAELRLTQGLWDLTAEELRAIQQGEARAREVLGRASGTVRKGKRAAQE